MKKIALKNGQILDCLEIRGPWVYMTKEQMIAYKWPNNIETDNGHLFVKLGIDVAGEIISVPSFAELLNYGLKQLRIRLKFGLKEEQEIVKGRIARVLHLIINSKALLEDEPDTVENELGCSSEEAQFYLEADRKSDADYEPEDDSINLFSEEITSGSLIDLLDNADSFLVNECNSLKFNYRQLLVQNQKDNAQYYNIKDKCGRNIRCSYLIYLLAGHSPKIAIQKVIEDQGWPEDMTEGFLQDDRNWPG